MRLVILGGPGAGKGTQAQMLCDRLDIPCIAMGEILREEIAIGTDLGRQAKPYVEKGELVPDPLTIEFIRKRLLKPDAIEGWLLDGYPRTAFQAEELDFLLEDLQQHLNWAIWLDVPEAVLMERSLARSRADDRPDIIERRLQSFYDRTIPIMEYYEPQGRLLKVNGNQSSEQVLQEILSVLKS